MRGRGRFFFQGRKFQKKFEDAQQALIPVQRVKEKVKEKEKETEKEKEKETEKETKPEEVKPPNKFLRMILTSQEMIAQIIIKARTRLQTMAGKDFTTIYLPLKKDYFDWALQKSEDLQIALLDYPAVRLAARHMKPYRVQTQAETDPKTRGREVGTQT
ncbi:hypothetical protein DUI87_25787 [Hirundo rustica rustica]|uniref:Uncharacterized protein n=1 Tax=Hirundo rustica rustica TaxID=333673 RepID=A0A3M0J9D0_HIRRU|nr:hypothetical protein DUI87_25787 [Hirundo rustica rustica]